MFKRVQILLIVIASCLGFSFEEPESEEYELVEVVGLNDSTNYHFVQNQQLY